MTSLAPFDPETNQPKVPEGFPERLPPGSTLVIATDAWFPQVNGVVTTMSTLVERLREYGYRVVTITPEGQTTVPMPTYPEIRLCVRPGKVVRDALKGIAPDAFHIVTEGPLGFAARSWALKRGIPFTTAYHTKFPEYLSARFPVPVSFGTRLIRWFHGPSSGVMVATPSLARDLEGKGFRNVRPWTRGVAVDLFKPLDDPADRDRLLPYPRPIGVYVGRIAVEKNIEAFLKTTAVATKVLIGGGPQMDSLKQRYPDAVFLGPKFGEDLARHIAAGDLFVFPSLTDTFGLVQIEALSCGLPVAAYPVTGPLDVLTPKVGAMDEDLDRAIERALTLDPADCRDHALGYSWDACARLFLNNLAPVSAS
ncbi:MAG: glycosyltransferase family 1 protein [Alphaproteobacteria bacterium]|nr:glycosyltransferase family 1 protein [Alphaproteobacteria bacterium]